MEEIRVTGALTIPSDELSESFARSGGPGGQHVNKTSSKVVLRWNLRTSRALTVADRAWLEKRVGRRLNAEGDVVVTSERFRDQSRNRQDAREKLAALLKTLLERPKLRKKGKPPKKLAANRLREKKHRAEVKSQRRSRDD